MRTSLALFLVLDTSVLEPDFDLFLRQVQVGSNLDAPQSGQVHVRGELALQLQELCAGEGCAHAFAALELTIAAFCKIETDTMIKSVSWHSRWFYSI